MPRVGGPVPRGWRGVRDPGACRVVFVQQLSCWLSWLRACCSGGSCVSGRSRGLARSRISVISALPRTGPRNGSTKPLACTTTTMTAGAPPALFGLGFLGLDLRNVLAQTCAPRNGRILRGYRNYMHQAGDPQLPGSVRPREPRRVAGGRQLARSHPVQHVRNLREGGRVPVPVRARSRRHHVPANHGDSVPTRRRGSMPTHSHAHHLRGAG